MQEKQNHLFNMENQTYKSYKKIRRIWEINPVEKIKPSVKHYNRNDAKEELRKTLNNLYDYDELTNY